MGRQRPNDGEHIDDIIDSTSCVKHKASKGNPCFTIRYDNGKGEDGPCICNSRAKKAGFDGKIHPTSLSRATQKEQRVRR